MHIKRDGTLLFVAARSGAVIPALRRNQALARETGLGARIAEDLIRQKVEGQLRILNRLPPNRDARPTLLSVLDRLGKATSLSDLRNLEAVAARYYWAAWRDVPVRFTPADRKRRPDYWRRFGSRVSPLLGQSPRKAVNPANAMLNYLYSILEAEARIAALAVGSDPTLGLLHTDQRNRDSLACDLMEPVRPQVDAYLLDLLARREFHKEEFFELRDGQCRLLPPLTLDLVQTSPRWGRAVLPVAQDVAKRLLEAPGQYEGRELPRKRKDGGRVPRDSIGGRSTSAHTRRVHRVVMREHQTLTPIQAGDTPDHRRGPEAGEKRRGAMQRVAQQNRRWEKANRSRDPIVFKRDILPGLKAIPLATLVRATGLTKSACSRIRAGRIIPHPRHWDALTETARI